MEPTCYNMKIVWKKIVETSQKKNGVNRLGLSDTHTHWRKNQRSVSDIFYDTHTHIHIHSLFGIKFRLLLLLFSGSFLLLSFFFLIATHHIKNQRQMSTCQSNVIYNISVYRVFGYQAYLIFSCNNFSFHINSLNQVYINKKMNE